MKWIVLTLFLIIGLSYAEINTENIPKIPDLDDLEVIKERCEKKGGAGTYDRLKKAREDTKTCLQGLIDPDVVQNEIEEAKKTGSMDEVFGKYCKKRPQFKECIKKTVDVAKECMEDNEKEGLNATTNILEQIGDFVCFRDGDRIAMFIAEGGVTCLKSRVEGIKTCVNSTFKINPSSVSLNTIPTFTIDKKKCDDLSTLQECIVKELEDNCKDSTPANIVEALFKFVKKAACKDVKRKRSAEITLSRSVRSIMVDEAVYQNTLLDLQEQLNRSCTVNGGEHGVENLLKEGSKFRLCMARTPLFSPRGSPRSTKAEILAGIDMCSKDLSAAIENCMDPERKYFPKFLIETVKSLVEFVHEKMSFFTDPTVSRQLMACSRILRNSEINKTYYECFNVIKMQNEVPTKDKLCGMVKTFSTCWYGVISNACRLDKYAYLKEFFGGFTNALESSCADKFEENVV